MKWNDAQAAWLREHYATLGCATCSAHLGVSMMAVYTKAFRDGLTSARAWSTNEAKLLREHYRDKGAQWCAMKLGRSKHSVASYARHHGYTWKRAQKEWTSDEEDLLLHGGTAAEIAKQLGRTVSSVRSKIKKQRAKNRRQS